MRKMRKFEIEARRSAYDYINRLFRSQSFVWVEVGTDDPDAETTQRQIKKGTKKVKSHYKNVDDVINTIIKSCFVPYLIDGEILYKNKYIDGINPYIFDKEKDKKILYLDLFGYDKIGNVINVKNEKTNYHRVLSGLLDIHSFYIKQSNTQMCSYVNDWSVTNKMFNYVKIIIENVFIYMTYFAIYIKTVVPHEFEQTVVYKILSKIFQDIFIVLLETYCL